MKTWKSRIKQLGDAMLRGMGVDNSLINVTRSFPDFSPNSKGTYTDKAQLTIKSVNQTFPFLESLCNFVGPECLSGHDLGSGNAEPSTGEVIQKLGMLLDKYGSDKGRTHLYHHLYGAILTETERVENVFEIGLGTNNADVVSNMGQDGRPGASLRAFRDLCPNAMIYGADVDRRILFEEDRIKTFYIDQTEPSTFDDILNAIPRSFDLVIDDGLHAPNANIASLEFGLKIVKKGGWVVIEDIHRNCINLWRVVAKLLPADTYECRIYKKAGTPQNSIKVFAVKRLK